MPYGFSDETWSATKAETIAVLKHFATRKKPIAYSELLRQLSAVSLHPHSPIVAHLLDDISRDEAAAGRGMLSVLVVHKHGDQMPGGGFFTLAKALGRDISDKEACWIRELELVASSHSDAQKVTQSKIDRLAQELGKQYQSASNGEKVVNIHMFGIRYAAELDGISLKELTIRAGLPTSYAVEINKGMNIAKHVRLK